MRKQATILVSIFLMLILIPAQSRYQAVADSVDHIVCLPLVIKDSPTNLICSVTRNSWSWLENAQTYTLSCEVVPYQSFTYDLDGVHGQAEKACWGGDTYQWCRWEVHLIYTASVQHQLIVTTEDRTVMRIHILDWKLWRIN